MEINLSSSSSKFNKIKMMRNMKVKRRRKAKKNRKKQ